MRIGRSTNPYTRFLTCVAPLLTHRSEEDAEHPHRYGANGELSFAAYSVDWRHQLSLVEDWARKELTPRSWA